MDGTRVPVQPPDKTNWDEVHRLAHEHGLDLPCSPEETLRATLDRVGDELWLEVTGGSFPTPEWPHWRSGQWEPLWRAARADGRETAAWRALAVLREALEGKPVWVYVYSSADHGVVWTLG